MSCTGTAWQSRSGGSAPGYHVRSAVRGILGRYSNDFTLQETGLVIGDNFTHRQHGVRVRLHLHDEALAEAQENSSLVEEDIPGLAGARLAACLCLL